MNLINTKEEIKNRMLRKAAQVWGVSPSDIDDSFDPIVSLLIGACASQISEINSEANNAYARIADNLINLMTPDASMGENPAHAVVCANPTEASVGLNKNFQFYTKKKITDLKGEVSFKSAFFSNINGCKLVQSFLKYAITGNHLISYNAESKRSKSTQLFRTEINDGTQKIYLGFPKSSDKISLKGVSLFFEIDGLSEKDNFYRQLKNVRITHNNKDVSSCTGFDTSLIQETKYIKEVFSNRSPRTVAYEKMVLDYYKKKFITIQSEVYLDESVKNTPELEEIVNKYEEEDLSNIHWLTIEFSNVLDTNALKYMYASVNCFPVLNRKLESVSYKLKENSRIVPLVISDAFLDIHNVSNQLGKHYKTVEQKTNTSKGTYFIKMDHIGRLDATKAKDQLIHLIDLLRNEAAAFSIYGNDFINDVVTKLSQNITLLENKMATINLDKKENKYIVVNPYSDQETLYVDYWTTLGAEGNQIKSGSSLMVYKGVEVNQNECYLVTTSIGGKDQLNTQEKIYSYRRKMLTQDRIVTKQDIITLCFDICGEAIKEVSVEKKFLVGETRNEGFIPTMMIDLYASSSKKTSDKEWDLYKSNLLSILQEQSHNILPFKILVKA